MGFQDMPKPPRIVALGGPVTAAIRAMRADEPATDYARIRELRRAIADRIEADIALLDALAPDADFEPSLSGLTVSWPSPHDLEDDHDGREPDVDDEDGHDAEGHTDDNGLGDADGLVEQFVGTRYAYHGAV